MTAMQIDRATVEQALEALEFLSLDFFMLAPISPGREATIKAITALRAALVQQAKPDHETRAELAEQQVVQLAEERDHYRGLWQKAQQAEQQPMHPELRKMWEDHFDKCFRAITVPEQAKPVQMHPSQFAEMIKGKEAMTGIPVYWAEWPNKEES